MSAVRKCDLQRSPECLDIFSELELDWQTFTGSTMRKNEQGQRVQVTQVLDACPFCAVMPEADKGFAQRKAELESREAAVRRRERELGTWDPTKETQAEMEDRLAKGTTQQEVVG